MFDRYWVRSRCCRGQLKYAWVGDVKKPLAWCVVAVTCPMYLASVLPRPPAGAEQRWCQSLVVTIRRHPVHSLQHHYMSHHVSTLLQLITKQIPNIQSIFVKWGFFLSQAMVTRPMPMLCLIINIETLDFTRQGTNNETWEYWEQWQWEMQVWRHCPCIVTDLLYGGWVVGTGRGRVTARQ